MEMQDWKEKFNSAETRSSSTYMEQGNYFIRIDLIKSGKNSDGIDNFKLEGTVVHVFEGSHTLGQSVCDMKSRVNDIKTKANFFMPEVKGLIADLMGMPPEQVTFENLLLVAGDTQPLKGMVCRYSAWNKQTKAGNSFTNKKCKGIITEQEFLDVADEATVKRFRSSCRFKAPKAVTQA